MVLYDTTRFRNTCAYVRAYVHQLYKTGKYCENKKIKKFHGDTQKEHYYQFILRKAAHNCATVFVGKSTINRQRI